MHVGDSVCHMATKSYTLIVIECIFFTSLALRKRSCFLDIIWSKEETAQIVFLSRPSLREKKRKTCSYVCRFIVNRVDQTLKCVGKIRSLIIGMKIKGAISQGCCFRSILF